MKVEPALIDSLKKAQSLLAKESKSQKIPYNE